MVLRPDKGSSVFGPAIVGAITDRYGGIRPAFIFLAVLVGLPAPLVLLVDVSRGRSEGRSLVRLEGLLEPDLSGVHNIRDAQRGQMRDGYEAVLADGPDHENE